MSLVGHEEVHGNGAAFGGGDPRESGSENGGISRATGSSVRYSRGWGGLDSHNLASTDSSDNRDLLNDMKQFIDSSER
jgi:hypothetical protein